MSAPKWEAPSELYFYDEWLQQNAKGRMLCGNNRYIRADLCTPTDERVRALVGAVWSEYRDSVDNKWTFRKEHVENAIRAALRDMDTTP